MRILIDECLDWRLCRSLPGHECTSLQRMGWDGLSNGALLSKAQTQFDVFITGDRNLAFQQAVGKYDLTIFILHPPQYSACGHATPDYSGHPGAGPRRTRNGIGYLPLISNLARFFRIR